ncbi:hypothetical protein FJZ36_15435 [Candidatus Poribacteria bacterium]|nr:hypothetical protein [Candidatus Poribacteria bacterium]
MHDDMLMRDEVRSAVANEGVRRPPLMIRMWIGGDCYQAYGDRLRQFVETVPEDVVGTGFRGPGGWEKPDHDPDYRWAIHDKPSDDGLKGIDSRRFLADWADLDEYIERMPDPDRAEYFEDARAARERHPDRYVVSIGFFCFYERLWTIRGMSSILEDMMLEPEKVTRLTNAVRDYHLKVIRRFGEAGIDAFYTSDDMGTQNSLFFSPELFRKYLKPAYQALIEEAHAHDMQFWLHTCGNVESIVEDFIEIGLDVLHPIQPFAMDAEDTVRRFGGRIGFMPGIDVQHLLPHCSPEAVVDGTRELIETFSGPGGGMIFSLSNAIHTDVSCENIEAFMRTAHQYGAEYYAGMSG